MLELLHSHPWRPVDARWQRATGILEQGHPNATVGRDSDVGCKWIKQAMRYRRASAHANSYFQKIRLLSDFPAIHRAVWIWDQVDSREKSLKWGIEARILARQSDREIAEHAGCTPDVIEAYEALFFSVRERLTAKDYILNCVLGQSVQRGVADREYDLLWKLFGYLCGPYVLDSIISPIPSPIWASRPEQVGTALQDYAIQLMKKKATLAALSVPVDARTQLHLIESFVKYVEVERTTDTAGGAEETIQGSIQALLAGFMPAMCKIQDQAKLNTFDVLAVEARADEQLALSVGQEPPSLATIQNYEISGA